MIHGEVRGDQTRDREVGQGGRAGECFTWTTMQCLSCLVVVYGGGRFVLCVIEANHLYDKMIILNIVSTPLCSDIFILLEFVMLQEKHRLRTELNDVRRRLDKAERELIEAKEQCIHLTTNAQALEREVGL